MTDITSVTLRHHVDLMRKVLRDVWEGEGCATVYSMDYVTYTPESDCLEFLRVGGFVKERLLTIDGDGLKIAAYSITDYGIGLLTLLKRYER